jgi:1,4-dihydroxy-2-naphthoate octaprenyltransferase
MTESSTPPATLTRREAWILAMRPRTLPAAVAPVVVGSALAAHDGAFVPLPALACLFAALMIQIGSNFANDLGDFERGADAAGRVGPTRVTTAGLITPGEIKRGMAVVFGLAALAGLYLILVGGWPILLIGVLSIVAAIAYTRGPIPFGYYGLGDLGTFVFFGLAAVCGTYYVQSLAMPPIAVWLAAVAMGSLVTAILVVNNIRDAETDAAAGKRTLAVVVGRDAARVEYALLLLSAYLVPFSLWLALGYAAWILLPLLTLPLAWSLLQQVRTVLGPPLNRTLAGTARLAVLWALAFAAGALLG